MCLVFDVLSVFLSLRVFLLHPAMMLCLCPSLFHTHIGSSDSVVLLVTVEGFGLAQHQVNGFVILVDV